MTNITNLKNKEKFIVSQSNQLIEANYPTSMTARAHKIARLILSLISPEDKDLRTYTISIDALQRYLGMSIGVKWGAFYKELSNIQDKLNEKPIEIRKPDGGYIRTPFLGIEVFPKTGTVTLEISGLLKPYLLELKKNYTSYLLINIPKLKSAYSIRLYELLHQYRKIGKRYFEFDDLQKKVGSNYPKYSNFKIKVLKQAQKDLKRHTDLAFVFDEIKEGRKVAGIQFIIFGNTPEKENPNQLSFLDDAFEVNDKAEKPALSEIIVQSLNALGVSEQNIAKYLAKGFEIITDTKSRESAKKRCTTLENYYLEKLELTKNSASSKENAAGFFIKALKEDWATSKTLQKHKKNEAVLKRKQSETKLKQLENQLEKLTKERDTKKEAIIEQLIANDAVLKSAYKATMDSLGDFIKGTLSSVKHLPIREQYTEKMAINSGVNIYLQENYPEKFTSLQEIEGKVKNIEKAIADFK